MRTTAGDGVVAVIDAQGLIEPVPTVVAVEALEQLLRGRELEGATHDACWGVLQRAVFHSAGLEPPPSGLVTDDELTADLTAALQVARGVVELVARRRWLRPTAMLADVVDQVSLRRWIEPHEAPLDPDADRLET